MESWIKSDYEMKKKKNASSSSDFRIIYVVIIWQKKIKICVGVPSVKLCNASKHWWKYKLINLYLNCKSMCDVFFSCEIKFYSLSFGNLYQ